MSFSKTFQAEKSYGNESDLNKFFHKLTLIVWRQEPDDKSRDSEGFNDYESIPKTVMIKYHGKEFFGKIPTVKSPTIVTFIG